MGKIVTYRFVDGEQDSDPLIVSSQGAKGTTTEMTVVQARNGIPEIIQKDKLVYDRQEDAFYVGQSNGSPKRVADIRVYPRLQDLPKQGQENRLYISLLENAFSIWSGGAWKRFSTSPVSVTSYNGVSTYETKDDFPSPGEEGQIYLTKDGYGYSYSKEKGYRSLFGGQNLSYTRAESDSRYALKSDIPAQKTLEELGGITPHDVDLKVQAAKDEADDKYEPLGSYDDAIAAKADKGESYTKAESDAAYAKKEDLPTLSSLGAVTAEQVSTTYATKKSIEGITSDIDSLKAKTNTLSSYAKKDEVNDIVQQAVESVNPDFGAYAKKEDVQTELDKKADKDTVALKTDLEPFALKTNIPTAESLNILTKTDAENTYAKIDDAASARKAAMDVDAKLTKEHYTKEEVDQKFVDAKTTSDASYLPIGTINAYVKKEDADAAYATKADLDTKEDKGTSYTKAEVDAKIASVENQGVDLTGYLKENDTNSDAYIEGIVKKNTASEDTLVKKDGLLAEVIKQDKAKDEDDLTLDYFVNKGDISGLSKTVRETGTVQTDANGKQILQITGKPSQTFAINVYVNGVGCETNKDYTYDTGMNQIVWSENSFTLSDKDSVIIEYETLFQPEETAPAADDSSTEETARQVAIAPEDLETIRNCVTRAEQAKASAQSEAEKSATSATESNTHAQESAKSAQDAKDTAKAISDIKDTLDAQKAAIDQDVAYLKDEAVAKDVKVTLLASKWADTEYTVENERIKANSLIFYDVDAEASDDAKMAFEDARLYASTQRAGAIVLIAEETPALDIPISMTIL